MLIAAFQVVETCRELGLPNATFGYVTADMADKGDNKKVIKVESG